MTGDAEARLLTALEEVLAGTSLSADEVAGWCEERCRHSYVELARLVRSGAADPAEAVARCLGRPVRRLALLPVPSWIEETLPELCRAFESVRAFDNGKAGRRVAGVEIAASAELDPEAVDACVVTTASSEIASRLTAGLPAEKVVGFERLAAELTRGAGRQRDPVPTLLERVRAAERPLVALCGIWLHTYGPTFTALSRAGFDVFVVARSATAFRHSGHFAHVAEALPGVETHVLDAAELARFAAGLDRGVAVVPGAEETFVSCAFDARRAVGAYAYPAALARLVDVPVVGLLYDVVKPVTESLAHEPEAELTYRRMLDAFDAVVLSANTDEAAAVVARHTRTPVTSFFRYPPFEPELRERRTDGFHLAIVGGLLGEAKNPFWLPRDAFRTLLGQGLHLHVYSSTDTPRRFRAELEPALREHLHVHASIADLRELQRELSTYHAGFVVNHSAELARMVDAHESPWMRELAAAFCRTIASSGIMLFRAAGLPIVVNRSNDSLCRAWPAEHFFPVEPDELDGLRATLEAADWDRIDALTRGDRRPFAIEDNVERLADELRRLAAPAAARRA